MNEPCCEGELDPHCGKLCSYDQMTHLMTRVEIIEGHILECLEEKKVIALRELMQTLPWQPCAVTMAVGSLFRQGILRCMELKSEVILEYIRAKQADC